VKELITSPFKNKQVQHRSCTTKGYQTIASLCSAHNGSISDVRWNVRGTCLNVCDDSQSCSYTLRKIVWELRLTWGLGLITLSDILNKQMNSFHLLLYFRDSGKCSRRRKVEVIYARVVEINKVSVFLSDGSVAMQVHSSRISRPCNACSHTVAAHH